MAFSREQIIEEIKRTANQNGGKPLGADRLERETGIKPYDIGRFWARLGDAQQEAGFIPNVLQTAHADEFVIEKIIDLMRRLDKFPTIREIALERSRDAEFPSKGVFNRLGTKTQLIFKILQYCDGKTGYSDVVDLCKSQGFLFENTEGDVLGNEKQIGEVYLFKSGKYYKIGKTNDTVRRGNELRIQLPENLEMVHSIKTDDPSGIETYWHKRFDAKRMNGEWFNLNSSDIKAFKAWKRII